MTHIKGHYQDFHGVQIWVKDHEDTRAGAKPEPKNLKPIHMPPPQALKPVDIAPKLAQGAPKSQPAPKPKWWDAHPLLAKIMPKVLGQEGKGADKGPGHHWPSKALEPHKPFYPNAKPHPQQNEKGGTAMIHEPSAPTAPETWADPAKVATFTPGGPAPDSLNGVPLKPWLNAPATEDEWSEVEGQNYDLDEPFFDPKREPAAGVVIEEPDGRIWVIHPTNKFGGYSATFPKGHQEGWIGLQASAIKEAYEEAGLKVEITGFLMDAERTTTTCRYYTARRVGGTPAAMGWESQAASLVPRAKLYDLLNRSVDYPMAEALGAGPAPKPPAPSWSDWHPHGPKAWPKKGEQPPALPWDEADPF